MNKTVFWSLAILALFIWLVFRPFATARWKIMALIAVVAVQQPFAARTLMALSRAHPLKYDFVLQWLDQALGLTAFQIARLFTAWDRTALLAIYEFLSAAMVAWYGIHLVIPRGEPRKLLYAYLIVFLVGGCLYEIVPALGPRYAFGALFPMGTLLSRQRPRHLMDIRTQCRPCMWRRPCLLVLFAARNRFLLPVAVLFLAGTVAATLAFEHYVMDLAVAVPFACFAANAARGKLIPATQYLGLVLAWLLLIRFAWPELVQHPWALRLPAQFSAWLGVRAIAAQWMGPEKMAEGEGGPSLPSALTHLPSTASVSSHTVSSGDRES